VLVTGRGSRGGHRSGRSAFLPSCRCQQGRGLAAAEQLPAGLAAVGRPDPEAPHGPGGPGQPFARPAATFHVKQARVARQGPLVLAVGRRAGVVDFLQVHRLAGAGAEHRRGGARVLVTGRGSRGGRRSGRSAFLPSCCRQLGRGLAAAEQTSSRISGSGGGPVMEFHAGRWSWIAWCPVDATLRVKPTRTPARHLLQVVVVVVPR
jgi:hypothetical protein